MLILAALPGWTWSPRQCQGPQYLPLSIALEGGPAVDLQSLQDLVQDAGLSILLFEMLLEGRADGLAPLPVREVL